MRIFLFQRIQILLVEQLLAFGGVHVGNAVGVCLLYFAANHLHWNAIESAYRQSPFFEYYADDFRPFYEKKYDFLLDFNEQLRELVCGLIGFSPRVELSTEYLREVPEGDTDLRALIHPKHPCTEAFSGYMPCPYYQIFKERHGFLPDLSIVDLLFNMGPESLLVLRKK